MPARLEAFESGRSYRNESHTSTWDSHSYFNCNLGHQKLPASPDEVHRLYIEDQQDRGVGGHPALSGEQMIARDGERRTQVHEMLESGALKTAEDFHDAAFIYQHGQTANDYLLAHVLATIAVAKGDTKSLWISAATLDRYLSATGQAQVFGTQYHSKDGKTWTQDPYQHTLVTDPLRAVLCVPSSQEQEENLTEFNAGKYPVHMIPKGCSR